MASTRKQKKWKMPTHKDKDGEGGEDVPHPTPILLLKRHDVKRTHNMT